MKNCRAAGAGIVMYSYKKGGKVKKGGMAKVHTGEHVLTTKQTKKLESNPKIKKALGVKKS